MKKGRKNPQKRKEQWSNGEDEKVTARQREKTARVWENGETSEAHEETGCEEDLPPSVHNTRLLLEEMTSKNKTQEQFCKIQRELNHTLVTREAFQPTDTCVKITEKATFTERHPLVFFKLNRGNKEMRRRRRSEALLSPTGEGNAVVYILR